MAKVSIQLEGFEEIIKKLDKMGAKFNKLVPEALQESMDEVNGELANFMIDHNRTGDTWDTLEQYVTHKRIPTERYIGVVGFRKPKGLPAQFLNIGTPFQSPTFFIDKAFDKSRANFIININEVFKKAISTEWGREAYFKKHAK